jgi:hypothetical protein
VSSGRISQSTFLTGDRSTLPIVKKIEGRINELFASAECVALNTKYNGGHFTPVVGAEPIQVVKYDPGNFYTAHFDNRSGSLARSVTFMVYLNDVVEGGCTYFPKAVPYDGAAESGIRIHPRKVLLPHRLLLPLLLPAAAVCSCVSANTTGQASQRLSRGCSSSGLFQHFGRPN